MQLQASTVKPLLFYKSARHIFGQPISWLVATFILIGSTYALITPLFEASDELWHYPMVQHLSRGGALPVQDPNNVGPWRQEASQPPLYYYLMGWATAWIDTSDMPQTRWLNPHVDNGIITPDGNINLAIHTPAEQWPWKGTVLAVRLIRLFSVLMSAGTVFFTYLLAREFFEDEPSRLSAAGFVAFIPMFAFISGSVNNDNLAALLSAIILFLLVYWNRHPAAFHLPPSARRLLPSALHPPPSALHLPPSALHPPPAAFRLLPSAFLGLLLGLAALTKQSALGLFPLTGLTIIAVSFQRSAVSIQPSTFKTHLSFVIHHSSLIFLPALLIPAGWYYRNLVLYGDLLGWNGFITILGKRAAPASLLQLWGERESFWRTYWGLFGGINVPMSNWIYLAFNFIAALAMIGLAIFLVHSLLIFVQPLTQRHKITPSPLHLVIPSFPYALLLLQLALLVYGLYQWATVTWSMQGRLFFSGISALAVLFVMGLRTILPNPIRPWALGGILIFMAAVTALAPFAFIQPAYADPPALTPTQLANLPNRRDVDFGSVNFPPEMRLLGYTLDSLETQPGDSVRLTLYWQALVAMDRDWSIFVHLLDENQISIAQRDVYPGRGLMPTRKWAPGQTLADTYIIPIPETAYAPSAATLEIGLYDYTTGDRLLVVTDGQPDSGRDALTLTPITLAPQPGDRPNPQSINFGNQIELIGYDMDRRTLSNSNSNSLTLTLYWRARQPMTTNYSVFAHIRGEGETLWAQRDSWPLEGAAPTAGWTAGQVIQETRSLILKPDTPPGVYDVEVGLYADTGQRLQLVLPDGRLTENFIYLAKIRVAP